MKRTTILAGGAVVTAVVLAVGAVTVANAIGAPDDSIRLLDDHGVDTATVSPAPVPSGSPHATPEPGDDNGRDGVVTVPPAGPTVIDRHGDATAPEDDPGAHDQQDHGQQNGGQQGGGQQNGGQQDHGGHGAGGQGGDSGGEHGGGDER